MFIGGFNDAQLPGYAVIPKTRKNEPQQTNKSEFPTNVRWKQETWCKTQWTQMRLGKRSLGINIFDSKNTLEARIFMQ